MNDIPVSGREVTEAYLIKKYCVSRHQAQRLLRRYGSNKAGIDLLLGARGRTRRHRAQDIDRTASQVSNG